MVSCSMNSPRIKCDSLVGSRLNESMSIEREQQSDNVREKYSCECLIDAVELWPRRRKGSELINVRRKNKPFAFCDKEFLHFTLKLNVH